MTWLIQGSMVLRKKRPEIVNSNVIYVKNCFILQISLKDFVRDAGSIVRFLKFIIGIKDLKIVCVAASMTNIIRIFD